MKLNNLSIWNGFLKNKYIIYLYVIIQITFLSGKKINQRKSINFKEIV